MKRALVVGSRGQDGSYLTELLQSKRYEVFGMATNRGSGGLVETGTEISNKAAVRRLLEEIKPDEIYYLAAHHQSSERKEDYPDTLFQASFEINTLALGHFLSGILGVCPTSRLFYAASSRIFGNSDSPIQEEETPLNPVCPYGISKASGLWLCRYYRREFNIYSSVGILYNHESPRRSETFISKKIVKAAVAIKKGRQSRLVVGSLDALVDWGYAPDYVDAMWAILQLDWPDEFIVANGTLHSVRDFVQVAFSALGLEWERYVTENDRVLSGGRPRATLCGNTRKLECATGWRPKVSFEEMVRLMVRSELEQA